MKLPKITDLVGKTKMVKFSFYRAGELWYKCDSGFEFPVSTDDTGNACFLAEDKSIYFMRWVRKYLEALQKEIDASLACPVVDESKYDRPA